MRTIQAVLLLPDFFDFPADLFLGVFFLTGPFFFMPAGLEPPPAFFSEGISAALLSGLLVFGGEDFRDLELHGGLRSRFMTF